MTFASPVATAEFYKFAGILSAVLSQHHLLGFEIANWNSLIREGRGCRNKGGAALGQGPGSSSRDTQNSIFELLSELTPPPTPNKWKMLTT